MKPRVMVFLVLAANVSAAETVAPTQPPAVAEPRPAIEPAPRNDRPAPASPKAPEVNPPQPRATATATALAEAMVRKFPYVVAPEKPTPDASAPSPSGRPDDDVVRLPTVTVTAEAPDRMVRMVDEAMRREKAGEFTWTEGGRIYRSVGRNATVELGMKFNPETRGFNLLKISW